MVENFEVFCKNYSLWELYKRYSRSYPLKIVSLEIDISISGLFKKLSSKYDYDLLEWEREKLYKFYYKIVQNKQ